MKATSKARGPGLREQKKAATRLAISQVATRMFITRGFERVTVAEVAHEAGVSVNTVFNYFATKEDLFFDRAESFEQALLEAVSAREPGEPVLDALERRIRAAERDAARVFRHRDLAPFLATVEASPSLKAYARLSLERVEQRLVVQLAAEAGKGPDDAEIRVFVAQAVGVVRLLLEEFRVRVLRGERETTYLPAVAKLAKAGFAQLRRGVGDFGARRRSAK